MILYSEFIESPMSGLYPIADRACFNSIEAMLYSVEQTLKAGAALIQYRNKTGSFNQCLEEAGQLKNLCRKFQRPLVINDCIDCAIRLGCGVHIGAEDGSIKEARERLGSERIIGASCYNSIATAQQALQAGASYVAFGALFATLSKPNATPANLFTLTKARASLPNAVIVGIGGITPQNCGLVYSHGADMVATINSLWSNDHPFKQAQDFLAAHEKIKARDIIHRAELEPSTPGE